MATYVIKSWKASESADAEGRHVSIHGRQAGLISWLLSLLQIDPTVSIHVYKDKFSFEVGPLRGWSAGSSPWGW